MRCLAAPANRSPASKAYCYAIENGIGEPPCRLAVSKSNQSRDRTALAFFISDNPPARGATPSNARALPKPIERETTVERTLGL
jgi:hypothetical protein